MFATKPKPRTIRFPGSTVVRVDPERVRDYQRLGTRPTPPPADLAHDAPPGGWDRYDVLFVAPRSVSVLSATIARRDPMVPVRVGRVHRMAMQLGLGRLAHAIGPLSPVWVEHLFDSAGQPLLHTHVLLEAAMPWQGRWRPLSEPVFRTLCREVVITYERTVRAELSRLLGLAWEPPDPDALGEVAGLPRALLDRYSRPCRPLSDLTACDVQPWYAE